MESPLKPLIFYCFTCCILLLGLEACSTGKVSNGKSRTIEESKQRDVFIKELAMYPPSVLVNDSIRWQFKTAFVERYWKKNNGNTHYEAFMGKYQIVIIFSGVIGIDGNNGSDWAIQGNHKRDSPSIDLVTTRSPLCAFVAHLDYVPSDTITFSFLRYASSDNGRLEVVEKKELFSLYTK